MAATPETTKKNPNAPHAGANGPKMAEPAASKPAEPAAAKPVEDDDGEEKQRGAIPNMPTCVIWRDPATKKVVAALIHPRGGDFRVEGRGIGSTTGELMDMGYPIGSIRVDGPKWVQSRIPENVEVLGFANVQGFPLPTA